MPRSKSQTSSAQPATLKLSRAAIKKEHHQRFLQLVEASRQQARMAGMFAALAGRIPEKIPAGLLREMRAAVKRASKARPGKNKRLAR